MEHRLYVGNLPDDVSIEALRKRFEQCGEVTDVHLATDRSSGRMRGYAFVTMATAAHARAAIDRLNGDMFEDRPLRVNEAGEEREGSRSSKAGAEAKARRAKVTSQYRERHNMTYELDCGGVVISVRMFPEDETEKKWRVEATTKAAAEGAPPLVRSASAATRALALEEVSRAWMEATGPDEADAPQVDWAAVVDALTSVRAI